ncbi:MAG TPA: hypothetical protein ENI79_02380 [Rhodospirillales bacterium]|nr:hypothetical protein [Rhodospirillales bacterium]
MDIHVWPPGAIEWRGKMKRCALGLNGVSASKRESDGTTPAGVFPLRQIMYRADRVVLPQTSLRVRNIMPEDVWCDDPKDPAYNCLARLPFSASHEALWRQDGLYDVIVELGHNDEPVIAGKGSAIFLHVAKQGFESTEGCIALELNDLLELIGDCEGNERIIINRQQPAPRP